MMLIKLAASLLVNIVAALVASYFAPNGDGIAVFFFTLAMTLALPVVTSIWGFVKYWAVFIMVGKRQLVRVYKAELHKNGFPSASAFFDRSHYLEHLISSDEVSNDVKIRAALLVGGVTALKGHRPFTEFLGTDIAFRQAMEEYTPARSVWWNSGT